MKNAETSVLKELLSSFDDKTFDLDVWKIKASILIKKIFGEDDEKLSMIKSLHYDYSSWSLRDKTGVNQPDTVKEQAKGIIETAILELSLSDVRSSPLEILKDNLTEEEYTTLLTVIDKKELSEEEFLKYFSKIAQDKKDKVLSKVILDSIK